MEHIIQKNKEITKTILFDIIALSVVYFTPILSHYFALPIYYLEPMRLVLFVSIIFTSRKNTLLIAVTLPIFSFLVSAHPPLIKALIISFELALNAIVFFLLETKRKICFLLQ